MMRTRFNGFALMHALSGLGVWALCFVVLYGGLTIGCQSAWAHRTLGPINAVSAGLLLAWALHAGLLGVMLWRAWRRARHDGRLSRLDEPASLRADQQVASGKTSLSAEAQDTAFVRWLTVALHATAFIALVALAAPVLFLTPCV